MLAPCVFMQAIGKRKAIDAYDVCTVEEIDGGVQIQFMPSNKLEMTVVVEDFFDVVNTLVEARNRERSRRPRTGDEWKYGDEDSDDFE